MKLLALDQMQQGINEPYAIYVRDKMNFGMTGFNTWNFQVRLQGKHANPSTIKFPDDAETVRT